MFSFSFILIAGAIEIVAAAQYLSVTMEVYEKEPHMVLDEGGTGIFKLVATFHEEATSLEPIRLLHRSRSHYDLLEVVCICMHSAAFAEACGMLNKM